MSIGECPLTGHHFEDLRAAVDRYGIKNLVETGTGPRCSGLEAAKKLGLVGYSCDVDANCVRRAQELHPYFKVHHGESLGFLAQILPALTGPTFFWLDGHCPTSENDAPGPVFPPYEEMVLIKALKPDYAHDVLWLDDIAMITAPDNPHATIWGGYLGGTGKYFYGEDSHMWVEYLTLLEATHHYTVKDGILQVTPR